MFIWTVIPTNRVALRACITQGHSPGWDTFARISTSQRVDRLRHVRSVHTTRPRWMQSSASMESMSRSMRRRWGG